MLISRSGVIFVAQREAFVGVAYADGANHAVGFGRNDPIVKKGDTVDFVSAAKDLLERLITKSQAVEVALGDIPVLQQEFDVLVSLYDNKGTEARDEVISHLPDRSETEAELLLWNRYSSGPKKGQFSAGLAKRRWLESCIFNKAQYNLADKLDGIYIPHFIKCWDGDPETTHMYLRSFPMEVFNGKIS